MGDYPTTFCGTISISWTSAMRSSEMSPGEISSPSKYTRNFPRMLFSTASSFILPFSSSTESPLSRELSRPLTSTRMGVVSSVSVSHTMFSPVALATSKRDRTGTPARCQDSVDPSASLCGKVPSLQSPDPRDFRPYPTKKRIKKCLEQALGFFIELFAFISVEVVYHLENSVCPIHIHLISTLTR